MSKWLIDWIIVESRWRLVEQIGEKGEGNERWDSGQESLGAMNFTLGFIWPVSASSKVSGSWIFESVESWRVLTRWRIGEESEG
jgi:hypothetical protein